MEVHTSTTPDTESRSARADSKIPCSIALLTLNSDLHLEQCLESARRFDVFILDGNSTDRTLGIARAHNVPMYKQVETEEKNVRIKDFSEMRLRGRDMARHDWIFDLDSDEYIGPGLAEEVSGALFQHGKDITVAFTIENKHIIGGKVIEHSFNTHRGLRLYNKKSGVSFKQNKAVHEQYDIPENVKLIDLKNCIYSYIPDTYADCIEKDNYYLDIVRAKSFPLTRIKKEGDIGYIVRSAVVNFLRAWKVLFVSMVLYARYGYSNSLPFLQVMRYVRYNLMISGIRCKQLWYHFFVY